MSFGKNFISLSSKFNSAIKFYAAVKPKHPSTTHYDASMCRVDFMKNSFPKENLNFLNSCKNHENLFPIIPKTIFPILKKIIEPTVTIKIESPTKIDNEINLPCISEKNMIEPINNIVSKEAINMLRVRARKMRIHKRKKFRKRMKFVLLKLEHKKNAARQASLQKNLKSIAESGESYSAEKYIENTLKTIHWTPPVTRVRGMLAPQAVIKEHLKQVEEDKKISERIEECLNMKK